MAKKIRIEVDRPSGDASVNGARLYRGGMGDLLEHLDELAKSGGVESVVTPNVDHILLLRTDARWRRVFAKASLRIVDGFPLVVLSRVLGAKDVHRLTGADLLPEVLNEAATRGWRVAVIGGSDEAVEGLRRSDVGQRADVAVLPLPMLASPSDPASRETIDKLREFGPNVSFVCLGAPKQELWVEAWSNDLPAGVYVGAGASIDFLAGTVRRAPTLVQRFGLEWAWRLAQDPKRLAHRYLVRGPGFLAVAARSLARN